MTTPDGTKTLGNWGKGAPRRLHESAFKLALTLNKKPFVGNHCSHSFGTDEPGSDNGLCCPFCSTETDHEPCHRRRIFSLSLGDWLDEEVPIDWLARMLDTIRQCDQVDWLLLTKRPENFWPRITHLFSWLDGVLLGGGLGEEVEMGQIEAEEFHDWLSMWIHQGQIPKNIWMGTSVENQEMAEARVPALLKIPAQVHFLSCEPLLGPVDLSAALLPDAATAGNGCTDAISWVIAGGESGRNVRACNVEWIRSLVEQCKAAGVPCLVKQLGAFVIQKDGNRPAEQKWPLDTRFETNPACSPGVTFIDLKHKKGGDMEEWPEDIRIREFPKVAVMQ